MEKPKYTPVMRALFNDIAKPLEAFMAASERQGGSYTDAVIDATAILGEHACRLFACMEDRARADFISGKFIDHLPRAIAAARNTLPDVGSLN